MSDAVVGGLVALAALGMFPFVVFFAAKLGRYGYLLGEHRFCQEQANRRI